MRSYQILLVLFVVGLSVQNQVYLEAVSCSEGCYYQQFAQTCLCVDGTVSAPTRTNINANTFAPTHAKETYCTSTQTHNGCYRAQNLIQVWYCKCP